jgi:glycosyltransferase involved in cell wall biosynthesis
MSEPKVRVSVIIPCFNHGQFIKDAIASVESCQDKTYEIIIVNDGSTEPCTVETLQSLEKRGYFVINQSNLGLSAARNSGIEVAKGDYILPLDSDNKIRPEYICKSIDILDKNPDVGVVYGDANYFGGKTGLWKVQDFNLHQLLLRNCFDACAVFRKSIWLKYKYDESMRLGWEDWDFWLGVAEAGWKFCYVPEVLFDYRVRDGSMVSQCKLPENRKILNEYVAQKHASLLRSEFENLLKNHQQAIAKNKNLTQELKHLKKLMSFSFISHAYKLYQIVRRLSLS